MQNAMHGNRSANRGTAPPNRGMRRSKRRANDRALLRGIVSTPSYIPPRVLATPWNQLVVSWSYIGPAAASNKCFDFFTDLAQAMRRQSGIPGTVDIGFRLVSAQFWHTAPNGELNNVVRVRFMSLIEGITACSITDTLAQVEDTGTFVRNASVKFVWPKVHQANTFPSSSTRVWARITGGPAQQVLIHVKLLWKFTGASDTSLFNAPFDTDEPLSFSRMSLIGAMDGEQALPPAIPTDDSFKSL